MFCAACKVQTINTLFIKTLYYHLNFLISLRSIFRAAFCFIMRFIIGTRFIVRFVCQSPFRFVGRFICIFSSKPQTRIKNNSPIQFYGRQSLTSSKRVKIERRVTETPSHDHCRKELSSKQPQNWTVKERTVSETTIRADSHCTSLSHWR